ncbi:tannase/feruloyl esterase family alpha/beta hydrolase [bacterium BFN5]|nr:tannase/feruloyl esterase family alpha/beta hydrolase [bacterium BFN5]
MKGFEKIGVMKVLLIAGIVMLSGVFITPGVQAMSTFVNGAHDVVTEHLNDMTTNNPVQYKAFLESLRNDGRNYSDWDAAGNPSRPDWTIPKGVVPGIQIKGIIGDAHFVMRIPDKWNGRLVVGAPGGTGSELSADQRLSDYVLTKFDENGNSYAYAYTDKSARGEMIPNVHGEIKKAWRGRTAFLHPEDGIATWNKRMHELTVAAKDVLKKLKGEGPKYTYINGQSNGGYVTRYALENDGDLYDGGIDWMGVLWTPEVNNISIKIDQYRDINIIRDPKASAEAKAAARAHYGLPEESDFLIDKTIRGGKGLLDDSLRMKYDPDWTYRDWSEYGQHPEDYANYDWHKRPQKVKDHIKPFALTGNIKKPMITLHGTWDVQINPNYNSVYYSKMIADKGKANIHRLYLIEHAHHTDAIVGDPKIDKNHAMQPILPYSHQAFDILVDWVEKGIEPPNNQTVPVPQDKKKAIDIKTGNEIGMY